MRCLQFLRTRECTVQAVSGTSQTTQSPPAEARCAIAYKSNSTAEPSLCATHLGLGLRQCRRQAAGADGVAPLQQLQQRIAAARLRAAGADAKGQPLLLRRQSTAQAARVQAEQRLRKACTEKVAG